MKPELVNPVSLVPAEPCSALQQPGVEAAAFGAAGLRGDGAGVPLCLRLAASSLHTGHPR